MSNNRLKEIDILRALAFIFVVVQHTLGGFSNIEGIPYGSFTFMKLMYVMAKTAVPMFLFISAVGLFYVYFNKFDLKKYYIKRIEYVLIPYIIWSAINMIKLGNEDRFSNFFLQLIAGNGGFHLWYMGMALRLFIFFPVILWAVRKIHLMSIKIRTSFFIVLSLLYYYILQNQNTIAEGIGNMIFNTPTEVQQRIVNISFLFWYLFFVMGIFLALNYERIKGWLIKYKYFVFAFYGALFVYAYLNEIEMMSYIRLLSLLYTVCSITFFYLVSIYIAKSDFIYKVLKFIGDYSFAAYMAHVIVINYMANKIMLELNTKNYLVVGIITLIITSVFTPIIMKFLSYFPYSQYITGVKGSYIKGKGEKI